MNPSILFTHSDQLLSLLIQKSEKTLTPTRIQAALFILYCRYTAYSSMSQELHHLPDQLADIEFEATNSGPKANLDIHTIMNIDISSDIKIDDVSIKIIDSIMADINNLSDSELKTIIKQDPVYLDAWEFGPGTVLDTNDLINNYKEVIAASLSR